MLSQQTLIDPPTRSGAAGIAITGVIIVQKTRLGRTKIMGKISSGRSSQRKCSNRTACSETAPLGRRD
jgi:hypothetical protein